MTDIKDISWPEPTGLIDYAVIYNDDTGERIARFDSSDTTVSTGNDILLSFSEDGRLVIKEVTRKDLAIEEIKSQPFYS